MSEHLKQINNRPVKMSLYGSISVLSRASFIFGVFPFHKTFKFAYFITLGYIILFTACVASVILQKSSSLREIVTGNYYKSNVVSNFGLLFHFLNGCIAFYTISICSFFKTDKVRRTVEVLHEIDETLKKLGQKFQHRRDKYITTIMYFFGLITILSLFTLQATNIRREKLKPLYGNMWFALIFPQAICNIVATQVSCSVLAVYDRLAKVNRQLENVNKKRDHFVLNRTAILMKLHDSLCDVARQTNNNYMVQLFVNFMNEYSIVLFSVFYCYWMVMRNT